MASLVAVGCETAQTPPPNTGATPPPDPAPAAPAGPKVVKTTLDAVGLESAALDRSIDPCQDFYQFACGGWLAKTEIPADKSSWGRSFATIQERNQEALHKILENAKAAKDDDEASKKVGAFYGACMDEAAIEEAKTKPLEPLLAVVKKVKDKKSLTAAVTELHKHKIWVLFDIAEEQDFKDATKMNATLDQNGLGLPDRDYYTEDKWKEIRDKYQKHVAEMLKLAGYKDKNAEKAAAEVMKIETELAKVSKTRVERRDPKGLYNKIDRDGVAKKAADFGWNEYFKGIGFPDIKDVNVTSIPFIEGMNKLIGSIKPAEWQNYLTWHIVRSLAMSLPKAFVDEQFKMQSAITGQKELEPRWKRCVNATDASLGELLAQPFVKKHFSSASKDDTVKFVQSIGMAFAGEVQKLDWMDAATKQKALEKLQGMAYLIGYPPKWRSYDFEVKADAYAANVLAARSFDLGWHLAKVGKAVDRQEWHMTPPTVNAYYNPQMNHMVFPAGILQPPFYNEKANVAVNLGGMGMVVGHELTHGFDDEGSQFDAKGNLKNWWTDKVGGDFKAKTQCIVDQYGQFEALPGVKLNGQLTLGENIADNGGVKLAFHAYKALRKDAQEVSEADGFNEDQQFFLSVGQSWCIKRREELTKMLVQVDPHSPGKFRVNGSLSNLPEFAEAFQCKEGTPMRRTNACTVW